MNPGLVKSDACFRGAALPESRGQVAAEMGDTPNEPLVSRGGRSARLKWEASRVSVYESGLAGQTR
jgi:hypothetical protein